MNWPRTFGGILISWLLLAGMGPLWAQEGGAGGYGPEVVTGNIRTGFVAEYATVTPGQTLLVGMRQRIRPHWHTYWENPGDTGEPTEIAWRLPEGWSASEILWPAPERLPVGPLMNFGYSDEVMLLSEVTVPADAVPGDRVLLEADAYWLVCEEVCIPEEGVLSITLDISDTPAEGAGKGLIDAARLALPRALPWRVGAALGEEQIQFALPLPAGAEIAEAAYFPRARGVIRNAEAQVLEPATGGYRLSIPADFAAAPDKLDGLLVLTEVAGNESLRTAYHLDGGSLAFGDSPGGGLAWWQAILMAIAGGILLNLMPCVFPVLSIKTLSLVGAARGEGIQAGSRNLIGHGLVYAAGVVLGFIVLAALLLGLRAAGVAAGWGFHLQNPLLVLVLAWLFFLIGLNLSGFFEFGGRLTGLGQGLVGNAGDGHGQAFFTGLLATVVATPCTAPFMGVAMGYAMLRPWGESLAVFIALGAGMALPMVLLTAWPPLLARLPRPGPWMLRLRELLAFPMYASAVWLLWVLVRQAGAGAVLPAAGGAVALALTVWLLRLTGSRWRSAGLGAGFAMVIAALALVPRVSPDSAGEASDGWQRWSPAAVADARAAGPVFVNFTADWCITCKANEIVALETERVRDLFVQKGVTRLRADWTRRDGEIARALADHGRSGVPLYLWYPGPAAGAAEILPQILTESLLLERLRGLPDAPAIAAGIAGSLQHFPSQVRFQGDST